jgi:hypothetical protein
MTTMNASSANLFHPAILELLRLQSRGRRRQMIARFCQPRRLFLSALASILAVAWLGNAALTVWLRETAPPDTLAAMLSLGLAIYAIWHFANAAFFRPATPFEWTLAEGDLLGAMPLLPRDLVAYQVASVTVTTILKAGLFTVLLLPDLRSVTLGVVGLFLAMLALEMLRMAIDIATWGMSRAAFLVYRTAVVAGLVALGLAVGQVILREHAFGRINLGDGLLDRLLVNLVQLDSSVFSYLALPFRPFIDLIVADGISPGSLRVSAMCSAGVAACVVGVIASYAVVAKRVERRERVAYRPTQQQTQAIAASTRKQNGELVIQFVPHWGGAGGLAWRQLMGARRHWGSLLTAMIAPAVLTCATLFVIAEPYNAYLCTVAALAFYTFLLLPTALRFDFRRDFERLAILKGLPVSPLAAVVGQSFAPVVIATVFQSIVLAVAVAARSLPLAFLPTSILVMIPINVFVFALDNLIFLLYPHRVQQEGLDIFFRTMLTFTAKGLLFAVALAAVAGWGFVAAAISQQVSAWTAVNLNAYGVFAAGLVIGPAVMAWLAMFGLCRAYGSLDAVEDFAR